MLFSQIPTFGVRVASHRVLYIQFGQLARGGKHSTFAINVRLAFFTGLTYSLLLPQCCQVGAHCLRLLRLEHLLKVLFRGDFEQIAATDPICQIIENVDVRPAFESGFYCFFLQQRKGMRRVRHEHVFFFEPVRHRKHDIAITHRVRHEHIGTNEELAPVHPAQRIVTVGHIGDSVRMTEHGHLEIKRLTGIFTLVERFGQEWRVVFCRLARSTFRRRENSVAQTRSKTLLEAAERTRLANVTRDHSQGG